MYTGYAAPFPFCLTRVVTYFIIHAYENDGEDLVFDVAPHGNRKHGKKNHSTRPRKVR